MWKPGNLAAIAAAALRAEDERLRVEQAVRGIDALTETGVHPILAGGFAGAGLGVWPESPYPRLAGGLPEWRERERCDLVLTERAGLALVDPVARAREVESQRGTLFENAPARASGVEPGDACWIEVKVVGQHEFRRGVPVPNAGYTGDLLQGVLRDVAKLSADAGIRDAAAMAVVFAESERVARHDVEVVAARCLDRGLPVTGMEAHAFPVVDRIGNRVCLVGVLRVAAGGE